MPAPNPVEPGRSDFSPTASPEAVRKVAIGLKPDPRRPRGFGQRIAFLAALVFYLCAALSLGALVLWLGDLGGDHPVIASLAACVVFFIGGGVVLHVIGRADLPDLGFRRKD